MCGWLLQHLRAVIFKLQRKTRVVRVCSLLHLCIALSSLAQGRKGETTDIRCSKWMSAAGSVLVLCYLITSSTEREAAYCSKTLMFTLTPSVRSSS